MPMTGWLRQVFPACLGYAADDLPDRAQLAPHFVVDHRR
jgi:hypothetical protein